MSPAGCQPEGGARPRVLVLSENYPNAAFPYLGIWVHRLALAASPGAEPIVVAPIPWVPPGLPGRWRFYRRTPRTRTTDGLSIHHPRILHPVAHTLQPLRARLAWPAVLRVAERLHRDRPFDLIHAHFIFPDGVLAARLGRHFGIPVMTTEHANWLPWLADFPAVARQVAGCIADIAVVTCVSRSTAATVRQVAGERVRVEVLPNVVDEAMFRPPADGGAFDPDALLFVGNVRHTKGLDVLVRALASLTDRPSLRLTVVGDLLFSAYRRHEAGVRRLVQTLGLTERVVFLGPQPPAEVARLMGASALLVLPSRRESFGAVLVEALACGTPVVATRCGGPEDIVTTTVGRLVPPADPGALADAIRDVLVRRRDFVLLTLRAHAVENFGMEATRRRLERLYASVLGRARAASAR